MRDMLKVRAYRRSAKGKRMVKAANKKYRASEKGKLSKWWETNKLRQLK